MRHLSKARENAIVEYLDYQIPVTQRKNAIIEYLDYQIPVTQLKGPKERRYASENEMCDLNIWFSGR